MAKKNTSIWLEPKVQQELRLLSAQWGMPVGEVIAGLIKFSKIGRVVENKEWAQVFQKLYEVSMMSADIEEGWVGDAEAEEKKRRRKEAYAHYRAEINGGGA